MKKIADGILNWLTTPGKTQTITTRKANLKLDAISWDAGILLVTLAAYFFYFYFGQPVFLDEDAPWHLAAGHLIRELGAIPEHDVFSFTAGKTVWFNFAWGFDLLISYVETAFSTNGLHILKSAIPCVMLGIIYLHLKAYGISIRTRICVCALVAFAITSRVTLRPEIISFCLAALVHLILNLYMDRKSKLIYAIPFITFLWVNIHGYFTISYMLLGIYGITALLKRDYDKFRFLFLIGLASLAASLVNPLGWKAIYYFFYLPTKSVLMYQIAEWHALRPFTNLPIAVYFFVFILMSNFFEKRMPTREKFLTLFWLAMALDKSRNFVLFAIFSAPYLAICLQRIPQDQGDKAEAQLTKPSIKWAVLAGGIVLLLSQAVFTQIVMPRSRYEGISDDLLATHTYLLEHYEGKKIFNPYNEGGKLLYLSDKRYKIFVDGREITAYPEDVLKDYLNIESGAKGWKESFKKYAFDAAVVKASSPTAINLKQLGFETQKELGDFAILHHK